MNRTLMEVMAKKQNIFHDEFPWVQPVQILLLIIMVFIEIPLSQPNAELQCHFTIYNLKYNNKYICI